MKHTKGRDGAMANHKDEALKALDHVAKMLVTPLDPLGQKIAIATLEHAREHVEAIVEVKRPRKPKQATPDA